MSISLLRVWKHLLLYHYIKMFHWERDWTQFFPLTGFLAPLILMDFCFQWWQKKVVRPMLVCSALLSPDVYPAVFQLDTVWVFFGHAGFALYCAYTINIKLFLFYFRKTKSGFTTLIASTSFIIVWKFSWNIWYLKKVAVHFFWSSPLLE